MMRFTLRPVAFMFWLVAIWGLSLTTLAASEEGSAGAPPSETQRTGNTMDSRDEASAPSDEAENRTPAPRGQEGGAATDNARESEGGGATDPGTLTLADEATEEGEMLDASSLLSEEELRALEAEFENANDAKAGADADRDVEVTDASEPDSAAQTAPPSDVAVENVGQGATAEPLVDEGSSLSRMGGEASIESGAGAAEMGEAVGVTLGVAQPLSQREPTLGRMQLEGGFRYGLVGTGPTRFVNDLRFAWAEGIELRTSFAPYPSSLMLRLQAGKSADDFGAWVIDAGVANWDAGWRLVVDTGEATVGARVHWELVLAWQRVLTERMSWFSAVHFRYRMSGLSDDEQTAVAVESMVTYDLMPAFAVSAGLGYARTIETPVREVAVSFVETGRPGFTHFLVRDDALNEDLSADLVRQSVTVPLALTYGTTESFDVDLFCTPRIFPKFDIVFGAGLRIRYDLL